MLLGNIIITLRGTRSGERSAVNACHIAVCRPVVLVPFGTSRPTKATGASGVEVNESGNEDSMFISKSLISCFWGYVYFYVVKR